MLKQNSELRAQAREALRGKWPMAAVAALIYSAIAGGLSSIPFIGWIGSLLVGLPVAYGFAILMLAVFRGAEEVDLGVLFAGFQEYKLFLLDLSFIGWAILCLFTFGIGFFVLQPYVQVSHAAFYEDLKAQQGGIYINVEVTVES